jgi:hypothetical protein
MLIDILKYAAAILTILTGVVSIIWPLKVLGFTGLAVKGGRGVTEIRTILGAVFFGLGASALFFNLPETYQMLGITYFSMAIIRGIAMMIDKSVDSSNIISLVVEIVFGIVLVL